MYRDRVSGASLELVKREYDEYCWMQSSAYQVSRKVGTDDVSLDEHLEQKFLWGQTADTEDVTEKALSSLR